jgi:predicted RNA-binding protein with PIN domain
MLYLVDGHNLIPKAGLQLDSLDDENQLIGLLQEFCRIRRAKVDVYFDKAPEGQPASRRAGNVTAFFIRRGSSADAALEQRLDKLGKAARNWTVVSSDGRVRKAATEAHAGHLSSEEFAREMNQTAKKESGSSKPETTLSPGQVEEWLEEFKRKRK